MVLSFQASDELRSGYRVPSTGYRVPGTEYRVPSTGYRVPGTAYRVPRTLSPLKYTQTDYYPCLSGDRVMALMS
jgi:hypothetical protein